MITDKCQCSFRIKMVGDGCRYCQPQEYIDRLHESLDNSNEWVGLTDQEVDEIASTGATRESCIHAAQAKLKEKNNE